MKANETQRKAIELIIDEISWWGACNDIDSPTIDCQLENLFQFDLEDEGLNESQAEKIVEALGSLCMAIRDIRPKHIPVKRINFLSRVLKIFRK